MQQAEDAHQQAAAQAVAIPAAATLPAMAMAMAAATEMATAAAVTATAMAAALATATGADPPSRAKTPAFRMVALLPATSAVRLHRASLAASSATISTTSSLLAMHRPAFHRLASPLAATGATSGAVTALAVAVAVAVAVAEIVARAEAADLARLADAKQLHSSLTIQKTPSPNGVFFARTAGGVGAISLEF